MSGGREWYRELPYREEEEDEDPTPFIVEQLPELARVEPGAIGRLVQEARRLYNEVLSECLRRSEPEGSDWRPYRRLERNFDPDEPEPTHDYGPDAGAGLEDWDTWWRECWGRARANPGLLRDGSGLHKPPLVAVYHLVNRWWRAELRRPFRPDFTGLHAVENDRHALPELNPAARLLFIVTTEIDPRVRGEQLKRVSSSEGRHQDTTNE